MSGLRTISRVFGVVWRLQPALWVLAGALLLIGGTGRLQGKGGATSWLALSGAALLLICAAAKWHDYTLFVPGASLSAEAEPDPGPITYAMASGTFHQWDRFAWNPHDRVTRMSVQVRWQGGKSPPFVAVVAPDDLPETLPNVLEEADALSLWYPGVTTEPGSVWIDGVAYPGLRLSFPGKGLLLAFSDEATVARLCRLLQIPSSNM